MTDIIQVGEPLEFAAGWWCTHPGEIEEARRRLLTELDRQAREAGVERRPATFEVKEPGDADCPEVPLWAAVQSEPKCLIARALPHRVAPPVTAEGAAFLASLSGAELQVLRATTKRVARKYGHSLTDEEADEIIASRGPRSAEKMLAGAV